MNDKSQLLDELQELSDAKKRLDFTYFLYVLFSMVLICLLFFPKIYIQQQIYFKSRDISRLKSEYDMLKEENQLISSSIEEIRFKNQILDTLF
ncbi:MAG: hypothetical protein PHI89_02150 [Thiovulaceae bacterium]|jgi:cell division protein FtsL|nr:hypothetical protein [Sulfurimonadaceae bacterium]MDD3816869.1 hypothetical protein [Sulfurimonadaceae bacterium]